jgi:hypothetical protein
VPNASSRSVRLSVLGSTFTFQILLSTNTLNLLRQATKNLKQWYKMWSRTTGSPLLLERRDYENLGEVQIFCVPGRPGTTNNNPALGPAGHVCLGARSLCSVSAQAATIDLNTVTGFWDNVLVLLCYKRTSWCRIVLWPSLPRQAHKRNALRHIWMAWRRPQGMQTGSLR